MPYTCSFTRSSDKTNLCAALKIILEQNVHFVIAPTAEAEAETIDGPRKSSVSAVKKQETNAADPQQWVPHTQGPTRRPDPSPILVIRSTAASPFLPSTHHRPERQRRRRRRGHGRAARATPTDPLSPGAVP
jgi:hypothetical protein